MPRGYELPEPVSLPNKLFFRIGEVATIVGVRPHVIRFWETEFPVIRPAKSKTGQRVYSRREVEVVALIRHLLHERRFTIDGARRALRENGIDRTITEVRKDALATGLPMAREAAAVLREVAGSLAAVAARLEVPFPRRSGSPAARAPAARADVAKQGRSG